MIEYINRETGEGRELSVEVAGTPIELATQVGYLVGAIYGNTMKMDAGSAELFRAAVRAAMLPNSPTWRVNVDTGVSIRFMQDLSKKEDGE